jgi:hypothetical protein
LEVSRSDAFIAAAIAGVVVIGAGKVATSIVLTVRAVAFCCFIGGSFGCDGTWLNYLIKSRAFMSQAIAPFSVTLDSYGAIGPMYFEYRVGKMSDNHEFL